MTFVLKLTTVKCMFRGAEFIFLRVLGAEFILPVLNYLYFILLNGYSIVLIL